MNGGKERELRNSEKENELRMAVRLKETCAHTHRHTEKNRIDYDS